MNRANWSLVPLAFVFAATSYLLIGSSFLFICRAFGMALRARELVEIGYVSNVLDSLLPAAGIPGFFLIITLMRRQGVRPREALAPSLFRAYFNNVIFISFLPGALIYLLLSSHLPGKQTTAFALTAVLILLLLLAITAGVFSTWVRRNLSHVISVMSSYPAIQA